MMHGPAYSRAEGCFPDGVSRTDKIWCPVGRVTTSMATAICVLVPPVGLPQPQSEARVGLGELRSTHPAVRL